jgi:hypothetical protein
MMDVSPLIEDQEVGGVESILFTFYSPIETSNICDYYCEYLFQLVKESKGSRLVAFAEE